MVDIDIAGNLPGNQQTPSISAVILNFNGGDCLINCLQAIYEQETPLEAIIVVDNGSTDGSPDRIRARFPDVQLLAFEQNRGITVTRNAGLRLAQTDLVLLLDDDVYLAKDCLGHLLAAYQRCQATVACPRVILIPGEEIVQCDGAENHFVGTMLLRHGYQLRSNLPVEPVAVGSCIGACMLVNRVAVLAAGGFYEAFFYSFEDLEFSLHMRGLGYRFVCEPAAIVYHDRGEGTPSLSFRESGVYPRRRVYLQIRHRLTIILTHYRVRTLIVLAPALACYEAAQLAIAVGRGWIKEWLLAHLAVLGSTGDIWQRRRQVQALRRLRDAQILVGGPLPLAPGFIGSRLAGLAAATLSAGLNAYWRLARHWID